jgi:5-methylcytosine-specific restriction endonuclease McrA
MMNLTDDWPLVERSCDKTKEANSRWQKNSKWITNGTVDTKIQSTDPLPEGWKYGRSKCNKTWSSTKGKTYEMIFGPQKASELINKKSQRRKTTVLATPDDRVIFHSRYKEWRSEVFTRDNHTCKRCGKRGGDLQAHHIYPWQKFPAFRYKVSNGKTVCRGTCHREEHTEFLQSQESDKPEKTPRSQNYLLTTDFHLTDLPIDEYRWKIFSTLEELSLEYDVSRIYICGDLVDRKDRHSSYLVNKLIKSFRVLRKKTGAEIIILAGNHDRPLNPPYYWEFINYAKINYITQPVRYRGVWLLPFSINPKEEWEPFANRLFDCNCILMHQTITGALVNDTFKIEKGQELPILPSGIPVFSGDVHRPQTCGGITYVGTPHPVHFDETWKNRVILIKNSKFTDCQEIWLDGVKRAILDISSSDELNPLPYKEADQVRIRFQLSADNLSYWPEEQRKIQEWAQSRRIVLASLEASITGDSIKAKPSEVEQIESMSPQDIIEKFGKDQGLSDEVIQVGKQLVAEL